MRRRIGYVPTLKQINFSFDDRTYSGRHRHGMLYQAMRTLKQLARHLASLRAAVRTMVPVRPPRLAPVPTQPAVTVKFHVDARSLLRGLGQASSQLARLRQARISRAPDSEPSRRVGNIGGRHRLERLGALNQRDYLSAMLTRSRYVEQALSQLAIFASARAFGESTWKEARRADRYAAA